LHAYAGFVDYPGSRYPVGATGEVFIMRILMFLIGVALIGVAVANDLEENPLPFDTSTVNFTFSVSTFTLDTVLVVFGVLFIVGALLFSRLTHAS
jgi:hypothetical protein